MALRGAAILVGQSIRPDLRSFFSILRAKIHAAISPYLRYLRYRNLHQHCTLHRIRSDLRGLLELADEKHRVCGAEEGTRGIPAREKRQRLVLTKDENVDLQGIGESSISSAHDPSSENNVSPSPRICPLRATIDVYRTFILQKRPQVHLLPFRFFGPCSSVCQRIGRDFIHIFAMDASLLDTTYP